MAMAVDLMEWVELGRMEQARRSRRRAFDLDFIG
jgi:hypothetical protein